MESVLTKKNLSGEDKHNLEEQKENIGRHRWHILNLESLLRSIENGSVTDYEEVQNIKETVEYTTYYHSNRFYLNPINILNLKNINPEP